MENRKDIPPRHMLKMAIPFVVLTGLIFAGCGGGGVPEWPTDPGASDQDQVQALYVAFVRDLAVDDYDAACGKVSLEFDRMTIGEGCSLYLSDGWHETTPLDVAEVEAFDPGEIVISGDRASWLTPLEGTFSTFEKIDGEWRVGPYD